MRDWKLAGRSRTLAALALALLAGPLAAQPAVTHAPSGPHAVAAPGPAGPTVTVRTAAGDRQALAPGMAEALRTIQEEEARLGPRPILPAPALWMVQDEDTTIWLFGTVHGLPRDLDWHQDQLRSIVGTSSRIVKELAAAPDPAQMAGLMFPAGLDTEGPTLSSRIGPQRMAQLVAALAPLGLPRELVDRMRPWLAGLTLAAASMQKTGLDPDSGTEAVIKRWSDARGLPVEGLETPEQQIGFFRDLPDEAALAFLTGSLDQWDTVEEDTAAMVEAWRTGDLAALDRAINQGFSAVPQVRAVLLGERNARWARWIDRRMDQPGTVLVAVGAGHLVGPDSVQVFLAREGHTATRILAPGPRPVAPAGLSAPAPSPTPVPVAPPVQ